MKRLSLFATVLSVLFLSLNACKKIEGEGGSSTITGKIIANKKNSAGNTIATFDAANQDVYIIYGTGGTTHDDKVETSYDGTFEFKYLEKGAYTIFTYENCIACASGEQVILKSVEISKSKEIVNVGTIEITD